MTNRRNLLKGAAMFGAAPMLAQNTRPPNVLYLHSHDTGRHIQPYGAPIPTPNLMKLASEGILFRQAHDVAPTCSPSRAGLLTGQCAHSSGMLGLAHRGFVLHDYQQHMANALRKGANYRSALIGVQHVAKKPETIGYDEVVPVKNRLAATVGPAAVAWLKNSPKEPFFLDVGFQETHREFPAPGPKEDVRYTNPAPTVPDEVRSRQDMAAFKASARQLDEAFGMILAQLEASGLAQNTLVICTTDHGIAFPDMKCNLTNHGTGVFLIVRGPGGFSGGKTTDALVSQMDLFPTVCELANIERPAWLQGSSLVPLIKGQSPQVREELFAEVNYHAAYEPKRSARTLRWNYVKRFGDRRAPVLSNCDDSPSKTIWLERGWAKRLLPEEELYDLTFDPQERYNLAADATYKAALTEMRGRMDRWMKATDDPILKGPIQAPAGATANDPDSVSPKEPARVISG